MIKLNNFIPVIFMIGLFNYPVLCQESSSATVSGRIVDYLSGEPLGFATVIVYDSEAQDSSKIADAWNKGVNSDSDGTFQINEIPAGEYFVQVSFMGFKTKRTKKFLIESSDKQIDLKEIRLEESIEFLSGIEVTGERSTYNLAIDRKIYNVEEDIMSETMSATEILNNVPSVSIDYNGRVNLRGTPNINFFINGKPSALMRANPTAYLNSIPANSIEKIEVITNPSARYRPDGAGGIINIVLKGAADGWEGSAQGNIGNLDRYTGNIALGYAKEDFSTYGSYSLRHTTTPQDISDIRIEKDGNGEVLNEFKRETRENYKELSNIGNGGIIYPFKERNSLEISGEFFYAESDNSSTAKTVTDDKEAGENEIYTTDRVFTGLELEWQLGAAYEHEFEKEEHTLAVDVAYGRYAEEEDNNFVEEYTLPEYREDITHYRITKGGPVTELALEYANPLPGDREIELGYDGEFLTDNISNLSQYQANGSWIYDPNRTNDFNFTQNINSVWGIFTQEIESFSLSAGLRAEQVNITSRLIQEPTDSIIPNDYSKLYPSFNITYEKGDNEQIQLNYSKRVNRADSDEHNPFAEYDDPRTREVGNPYLKPEVIHSFELGYLYQKDNFSIIPTVYYRYKKDAFTEIREIVEDSILQTSLTNLDVEKAGGFELAVTGNIKDRVGLNFSANFFYSTLDASNLGYSSNNSQFNWDAKLIANFTLTKTTFAQLNAYYRSGRQTAQGYFEPIPLFNLGFRQDLFRKRASLSLTISDVFSSVEWESITDTPDLYQHTTYGRNSQIIYLGFTYRFGKNFQKRKPEDLKFEDEIEAGKPPPEEEE
jgi:outer membrane receptor protein involved in Fe transport